MSFINKLIGYRWSVYISDELRPHYRIQHDCPFDILTYVAPYYLKGKVLKQGWEITLVFNQTNQYLQVHAAQFSNEKEVFSPMLWDALRKIDSRLDHTVGIDSNPPVVDDLISGRKISVWKKTNLDDLINGVQQENTLSGVLHTIFVSPK